jgi:hypothetical protein
MNHPEIRARLLKIIATESDDTAWTLSNKHLMSLIKLYVEEEREACANVCDELGEKGYVAEGCAKAIRERGET